MVSVRLVLPALLRLRASGVDAAGVLAEAGLDPADFEDPDGRVPHDAWVALLEAAARATGDPCFGLHAAEGRDVHVWDFTTLLLSSKATIQDAHACVSRYYRIVHDGLRVALSLEDGRARCRLEFLEGLAQPPILFEHIFASWIVLGGSLLGPNAMDREVRFVHKAPPDPSEHERALGAKVVFEAEANEIVFPASVLLQPLLTANPVLSRILEDEAERRMRLVPEAETVSARSREWLTAALARGDASLEALADHLRMSPRTLRRRLRDEGTTHKALLDDLRRDLAAAHVREGRFSVDEIAFLVGFSEASAFRRAFKRWTGCAPGEYRRKRSP